MDDPAHNNLHHRQPLPQQQQHHPIHVTASPFTLAQASSIQRWSENSSVAVERSQPDPQIPGAFFNLNPATAEPNTSRVAITNIATSTTTPAQLRRKPNLNSNATNPSVPPRRASRSISGIQKSPSVPTFHTKFVDDDDDRPATSYSTANPPLTRTRSNSTANRSPSRRKPPASHSSHGVETSLGPPPSYSTRTLSQDRLWKVDSPTSRLPSKADLEGHETFTSEQSQGGVTESLADPVTPDVISSPETLDTQSIATPKADKFTDGSQKMAVSAYGVHVHEDDQDRGLDRTIRTSGVAPGDEDCKGSSSDERKSEDLFLNIARTDSAGQDQVSRAEKRRSRISLPFFSARSSIQKLPSPVTTDFDPALLSPRTDVSNYFTKRSSVGQHTVTAASAHPLDETPRPRTQGVGRAASTAAQSVVGARRYSNAATEANFRTNLRSGLPARSSRLVSESNALVERPRYADHNTTESTISTTAPSTVWDELDDLKSRIRKLELTGKLPTSSAAAMSSVERPRTATTAATTLSSSPKTKPNLSAMQSTIEGIPTNVHPLLHEALSQAKPILSNEVYQKLQATASDALQLVTMMNEVNQNGPNSPFVMASASERQIRRRAESMCRGLTELTIALSAEPKTTASPYRPASRDASSTLHTTFVSRRMSNEASDLPPVTNRVQSRLESRRTSQILGAGRTGYSTPDTSVHTPSSLPTRLPTASTALQRTSTLIRHRRAQEYFDGATDDENPSPSIRPVSRAMTEAAGGYRQSPRDRVIPSREYISQHPMPTQFESNLDPHGRSQLPVSLGSTFHLRRKFASPASVVGSQLRQESSLAPALPPTTPRDSFGRISLIAREEASPTTHENVTVSRGSGGGSTRRSLGLAGRIGSSVGSRLRAVRAERNAQQQQMQLQQKQSDVSSSPLQEQVEKETFLQSEVGEDGEMRVRVGMESIDSNR